jgi:hypothetical protein
MVSCQINVSLIISVSFLNCTKSFDFEILSRVSLVTRQITCGFWIWLLDLLDFNSYNYSYSLHRFTTRKPETCLLVQYHFTSYLIVYSLVVFLPLTVCRLLTDSPILQIILLQLFNSSSLCLHLLKTVFRQLSREHLVEGFGLSVVTKTTPPLCRKRLSMYALSRERLYNCHPDNDAYSALIVAVV